MVGAVEVLDAINVFSAELLSHFIFILVVEIEVAMGQLFVLLHDLVKDVDVQGQAFGAL